MIEILRQGRATALGCQKGLTGEFKIVLSQPSPGVAGEEEGIFVIFERAKSSHISDRDKDSNPNRKHWGIFGEDREIIISSTSVLWEMDNLAPDVDRLVNEAAKQALRECLQDFART